MSTPWVDAPVAPSGGGGAWRLMELQGALQPRATVAPDVAQLVGDVRVRAKEGKRQPCSLNIGTLVVEGEVAAATQPIVLLRRRPVEAIPTAPVDTVDRSQPAPAFDEATAELFDPAAPVAAAVAAGSAPVGSAPHPGFDAVGAVTERYLFRTKPVRSVVRAEGALR